MRRLRSVVLMMGAAAIVAGVLSLRAPAELAADHIPLCAGKVATIVGTDGADRISGTPNDDVIAGLGGRDRISGGAGNDVICGGEGVDRLNGGAGNDVLMGESGRDFLNGGRGTDHLEGGGGRDTVRGSAGSDRLEGGSADDTLIGGAGVDTAVDAQGRNTCSAEFATACNSGYFAQLPPGSPLPTSRQCAAQVRSLSTGVEHRPENLEPNGATGGPLVNVDGADPEWNTRYSPRVDGSFSGTTIDILRWGACKWGFDEDLTMARAVVESSWRMSTLGDETTDAVACSQLGLPRPCHQSYGLLQVKGSVHLGTYPRSALSTAFGVDYALAWLRTCYEGGFSWLAGGVAGNVDGCVGAWFSGSWLDAAALDYLDLVDGELQARRWETPGF